MYVNTLYAGLIQPISILHIYIYIYIIYRERERAFNKFPDIFVQALKVVVDSRKFSILLLYTLWDGWPIFIISGSNKKQQQQLEYTLVKLDCQS